jgi:hypothetical protein|tara:strand:- start:481 stop:618 length:138 start_codon:yes stop_codon:yes gene_type:complete
MNKKDKEIVLAAVKNNDYVLKFVNESLKKHLDILAIVNKKKKFLK